MYVFSFIIKLFVGEKARVDSSTSGPANAFISGLLLIFLADADLDGGANPLVVLIGLDLDEEEPFVSFHLFHIFLGDGERVSPCEHSAFI